MHKLIWREHLTKPCNNLIECFLLWTLGNVSGVKISSKNACRLQTSKFYYFIYEERTLLYRKTYKHTPITWGCCYKVKNNLSRQGWLMHLFLGALAATKTLFSSFCPKNCIPRRLPNKMGGGTSSDNSINTTFSWAGADV